jgi:4'-phosphopantetheinyl transferase
LTSLELMTEEVQVWVASLEVADARYAHLSRSLSREERGRADGMAPLLGRRFIVARGILRFLLSGFTGTPAEKLRFTYGTSGKPSLADHDIHFNVSHSAELGVFAFAPDRAVGIDVENERPVRRLLDVAQRFMSEDEIRSLAATAPEDRDAAFLRSWVVREARLKAEGRGVWSGAEATKARANLTHKLFAPRPGYIAAVAAADSDWRLYTCAMKD